MSSDSTPADPAMPPQSPIVVHSEIHGDDIAEWAPAAPPRQPPSWRTVSDDVPVPGTGQSPPPPELAAPSGPRRAYGLDALRGLFLILMTLGFTVGVEKYLPVWMFHRQEPWGTTVDVAGISWRDLAYASFLFTMAAALPLTMSRRIEKGDQEIGILLAACRRWALLTFYAILIAHSNTYILGYTQTTRVLSIIGFVLLTMVFTRRRSDWDEKKFRIMNLTGWALAIAFLLISPMVYGKMFSFDRNDDIIIGLAFASFFGIVIWYFTRENVLARIAVLAVAMALYLGAKGDGWVADWWWDARQPWLFSAQRFTLLAVVIPGTIMGDIILRWMRSPGTEESSWTRLRLGGLVVLATAFTPIVTVGMYHRWVGATTMACAALLVGGGFLVHDPRTPAEKMIRSIFLWAGVWMLMGLVLDPFENGIHKEPDTLSYYFTITGTTSMLLLSLTAIVDALKKQQWVSLLIDLGHNPLMMYVLFTILINPGLELIPPMRTFLLGSFGVAMVRSLLSLILVILIVRTMSRKRIYWRA